LWEDVRLAKEMLSRAASTYVHVPLLDESIPLGREELEQLARPILDRTVTATQLAIASAGINNQQISAIFLVGGSSRIPLCATLLHRAFGIAATAIEQPELVVAEGALQLSPPTGRASVTALSASPAASPLPGMGPSTPAGGTVFGSPAGARPVSGAPMSGMPVSPSGVAASGAGPGGFGPGAAGPGSAGVGGPGVGGPGFGPASPPVSAPPTSGPPAAMSIPPTSAPPMSGPPVSAPPVSGPPIPPPPTRPAGMSPAAFSAGPPPPAGARPPVGWVPPAYAARPNPAVSPPPPVLPPPVPPPPYQPPGAPRPMGPPPGGGAKSRTPLVILLVVLGVIVLLGGGGGLVYALRPTGGGGPTNGPSQHGNPPGASPACGYKLAYLGVLSGDNASDGLTVRDSMKLAVEQYNSQHSSCQAEFVDYDTKYDESTSKTLAQNIAADSKILGVVGPIYQSEINSALPELDKAGVSMLTPSASEPGLSNNGWRVFHRMLGTDIDQADAGARYLSKMAGAKKVAIVSDDSEYGTSVSAEVSRSLGDAATATISIKRDDKDYSAAITQVTNSGADWLYLGAFYDDGAQFVKQFRAKNKTIKIMSGDRVFTDVFITDAGKDAAEGVVMTCPCIPASHARDNFSDQFNKRFGRDASYYGPEAFDAANILLAGLNSGASTRTDMLKFVNAYDGEGVSRRIKFTAKGDLDTTSLQVWAYHVSDGFVNPDQVIPDS
jgi:branched-chain amino acid transport system substrate-binding protein